MPDVLGQLLPVYFVVDESPSMSHNDAIGQVNAGVESLFDALLRNPLAAAKVRLTITGFASSAVEHRSLCDIREEDAAPVLSTRGGGTSYRAALEDLYARIPQDGRYLHSQGYETHRPAVFFLTDGEPNPNDGWEPVHARLMDRRSFPAAPNLIAFGINEARPESIAGLASAREFGFVAVAGADMGPVVDEFVRSLVRSVVQTGSSLAQGGGSLMLTKPNPEVLEVAADIIRY